MHVCVGCNFIFRTTCLPSMPLNINLTCGQQSFLFDICYLNHPVCLHCATSFLAKKAAHTHTAHKYWIFLYIYIAQGASFVLNNEGRLPPLLITVWRFSPSLSVSLSLSHTQKAFTSSQLVAGPAHSCITHLKHANTFPLVSLSLSSH